MMLDLLVFVLTPTDMVLVPRVENSGISRLLFGHEDEDEQEQEQEQEHEHGNGHENKSGTATVRERTRGPTAKKCVRCVSR